MYHHIFGELAFDYLWKGTYKINLFNETLEGNLNIYGEEEEDIKEIQVEAFQEFEKNKRHLCRQIEDALFKYYQSVVLEYRANYGESADTYAPLISKSQDMKMLIKFEALNLPYSFLENERLVGVLFQAKWEEEHGVGVKIVNREVVEVGYQDIVL